MILKKLLNFINKKNLKIKGFFTHLCVSDSNKEYDILYTKKQIKNFYQLLIS